MAILISAEQVGNAASPILVSNTFIATNTAATQNLVRVTLAGLALPTAFGSCLPSESVQVAVYCGANGLSNDALVLSQVYPANTGVWAADILIGQPQTVTSNLQVKAVAIGPTVVVSSPTTNGAVNVANTGCKFSVYVAAVNGGGNGNITIETGILANANATGFGIA